MKNAIDHADDERDGGDDEPLAQLDEMLPERHPLVAPRHVRIFDARRSRRGHGGQDLVSAVPPASARTSAAGRLRCRRPFRSARRDRRRSAVASSSFMAFISPLEDASRLAHALGEGGKLRRAEQQQDHREDDQEVPPRKSLSMVISFRRVGRIVTRGFAPTAAHGKVVRVRSAVLGEPGLGPVRGRATRGSRARGSRRRRRAGRPGGAGSARRRRAWSPTPSLPDVSTLGAVEVVAEQRRDGCREADARHHVAGVRRRTSRAPAPRRA